MSEPQRSRQARALAEAALVRIVSAAFHATRSPQRWGSGEFEVELTSAPPWDGGVGGEVCLA